MALKNSLERLTIGQLANLSGMGIETIRFCERKRACARPSKLCYRRVQAAADWIGVLSPRRCLLQQVSGRSRARTAKGELP